VELVDVPPAPPLPGTVTVPFVEAVPLADRPQPSARRELAKAVSRLRPRRLIRPG
jgi:hypothetical protein